MNKQLIYWLRLYWRLLGWLCALPVYLAIWGYRACRRLRGAWVVASRDTLPCPGCRRAVSLIGRFQCSCGYVFDGFGFARCPVCGDIPPYIPCQHCGVGVMNPTR